MYCQLMSMLYHLIVEYGSVHFEYTLHEFQYLMEWCMFDFCLFEFRFG